MQPALRDKYTVLVVFLMQCICGHTYKWPALLTTQQHVEAISPLTCTSGFRVTCMPSVWTLRWTYLRNVSAVRRASVQAYNNIHTTLLQNMCKQNDKNTHKYSVPMYHFAKLNKITDMTVIQITVQTINSWILIYASKSVQLFTISNTRLLSKLHKR